MMPLEPAVLLFVVPMALVALLAVLIGCQIGMVPAVIVVVHIFAAAVFAGCGSLCHGLSPLVCLLPSFTKYSIILIGN
jgi:hypothetical protein